MALFVLGNWVDIQFNDMVPQYSTIYFVLSQIWNENFNMLQFLSRYHFNIKSVHIYMLTKFHENQR